MALIDNISNSLNLNKVDLEVYIRNSNKHYSSFTIPKRRGGERLIHHPSPLLKTIQYWLNENIFSDFPISDHAFAYRKGLGIKDNARYHLLGKNLLHLDIKNFFESITRVHLEKLFKDNMYALVDKGINEDDFSFLLDACSYRNGLTIGSVSSPLLSNCVMYDVDLEIRNILPYGMRFSRYADDMVFSFHDYIEQSFVGEIKKILKKYGFTLNEKKTCFMSSKREVTGLILNEGKVSIGTRRKKQIKKMVYDKMKKNEGDSLILLGYLAYLKDIEPNYFNHIILKYSDYGNVMDIILKDIRHGNDPSISDSGTIVKFVMKEVIESFESAAPALELKGENYD